jgi:DNA polymerase eta
LVKGEEAQALTLGSRARQEAEGSAQPHPPEKRRRIDDGGIQRFFNKKETTPSLGSDDPDPREEGGETLGTPGSDAASGAVAGPKKQTISEEATATQANGLETAGSHPCFRCGACFEASEALQSHQDWHFAKDLQEQERGRPAFGNQPSANAGSAHSGARKPGPAASKRAGRPKKTERGQQRLSFG